jgi:hypothetical protein
MNSRKILFTALLFLTLLVGCESSSTGGGSESQNAQSAGLSERQKRSLDREVGSLELWSPIELMGAIYRLAPDQINEALVHLDQTFNIECSEQCLVTKKEI